METRTTYPTDLTDKQWAILEPLLPEQHTGRPRKYSQREMLNAIFYLTRTGCSWRMLPHDLPPWKAVYAYFRKLQQLNLWQKVNDELRSQVRLAAGREPHPSTLVADSQSVKTTEKGGHVVLMAASG